MAALKVNAQALDNAAGRLVVCAEELKRSRDQIQEGYEKLTDRNVWYGQDSREFEGEYEDVQTDLDIAIADLASHAATLRNVARHYGQMRSTLNDIMASVSENAA